MKKIFLFLLMLGACSIIYAQGSLSDQAVEAYKLGDYSKSASLYEEIAKTEGISADLYYNMGNAFFKDKQYPMAILNYERALLMDPAFSDAKFNLELAKLQTVDKIVPIHEFFLTSWFNAIRNCQSSNAWSYWGIGCFLLTMAGLFLYTFSRKSLLRKIGFFGGIILLVVSIFSNIFAFRQKEKLELREHAIVFTPTVTVKGSPAESG
ncbi:MAG: tetratricopeptide repeat protein, partial [Bacteroidales bacterium]